MTGRKTHPGELWIIALLLAVMLSACAEEADNGRTDADALLDVDAEGEGGDMEGDPGADPDDDPAADPAGDNVEDVPEDTPAEEVDVWECGCPDPVLPECGTLDRVTFSFWDDSMIDQLRGVFACATESLDIAIYNVEWECVVDALLAAKEANSDLAIRIIVENDNCGTEELLTCDLKRLVDEDAAEVILDGRRSYLMHHKFIVVDAARAHKFALMGSANYTFQSHCEDHNGNVLIDNPVIVGALSDEFERMAGGDFGDTPWTEPIGSAGMDLYFSPPGDDWQDEVLAELNAIGIGGSIHFMVYAFTRQDIADAFIAAHERGATVTGLASRMFAGEEAIASMMAAGIDVKKSHIHHKVTIMDSGSQKQVFLGSGNYSTNAREHNNEAVLMYRDDEDLYNAYKDEFDRVWEIAVPIEE